MEFIYKPTGEVKDAYQIKEIKNKYKINFTKDGKDYWYDKENIEIIEESNEELLIYSLYRDCFKCKEQTKIYTYMVYSNSEESLKFPWDKKRLNNNQGMGEILLHMKDPEIEYYPIDILGNNSKLDNILLSKYSKNIKLRYSYTQKRKYAMNICDHCGANQGEFYIYRDLNKLIKSMDDIEIEDRITL